MKKLLLVLITTTLFSCSNDELTKTTDLQIKKESKEELPKLTPKQIEEITTITINYVTKGLQKDGFKCGSNKTNKKGGLVLEYSGMYVAAEWYTDAKGKLQLASIDIIPSNMLNWYCDLYTKM